MVGLIIILHLCAIMLHLSALAHDQRSRKALSILQSQAEAPERDGSCANNVEQGWALAISKANRDFNAKIRALILKADSPASLPALEQAQASAYWP